jgi:hypothetical protein
MKDASEHLSTLMLGYMWNHPVQKLNDLLEQKRAKEMDPELTSALQKLTPGEKRAMKKALISIITTEMSDLCGALEQTIQREDSLELTDGDGMFSSHLPPWNDRLSYFDRDGNPRQEFM